MIPQGPAIPPERLGPALPQVPVLLSVPHAGRDYPPEMLPALRLPVAALRPLEDRFVDALARAALRGETAFIARRPRAWIDLNRAETERDPRLDDGADPQLQPFLSAKVQAGLGLVPRRAGTAGDVWRRRLSAVEVERRIVADHRPYHAAIADGLAAARQRFGRAVLLDLHSMPPPGRSGAARLVVGDRFGQSAGARFVARIEKAAAAGGLRVALNSPYAGGHILDRHGDPRRDVHAIQLEIDRSLYLDAALDRPGPGLARMAAMLRAILDALADEALPAPLAAE